MTRNNCTKKYCRGCGYILDGLLANECPECGRDFDPQNPQSYALHSRCRKFYIIKKIIITIIILTIVALTWIFWFSICEYSTRDKIIQLGGNYITHDDGHRVFLQPITRKLRLPDPSPVRTVILYGPGFTDNNLLFLSNLPYLETIRLTETAVTSHGAQYIVTLSNVKSLGFHGCEHIGPEVLASIEHMHGLEQLYLYGRIVDRDAIGKLQQKRPDLEVVWFQE